MQIAIQLCGETTLADSSGEIREISGVKPIRILEMLALQQGVPLSKDVIVDRLWEDNPPRCHMATLESYISNLRSAMGSTGRAAALATTSRGYVLTDEVAVDVTEIKLSLRAAHDADDHARQRLVRHALSLYRGPLMAGNRDNLWAERARFELTTALVESCTEAARAAVRTGDDTTARALAERVIDLDCCAEGAWQVLLECLERAGRTGEALTAYGTLRATMVEHLGVEPSPCTREIYARLLAADGGGRAGDRAELSALLRLLRQRLEGWPGIDVPEQDSRLAEVAAHILAVA